MERDNFLYKTRISFMIVSEKISADIITKELLLDSHRAFKKGEKSTSKYSGSTVVRPHNLWEINSQWITSDKEDITSHIEYFKSLLLPQSKMLKKYVDNPDCEVSFWIWIETDNAGIGMDLSSEELKFMSSLSNRIHLSVIIKNTID